MDRPTSEILVSSNNTFRARCKVDWQLMALRRGISRSSSNASREYDNRYTLKSNSKTVGTQHSGDVLPHGLPHSNIGRVWNERSNDDYYYESSNPTYMSSMYGRSCGMHILPAWNGLCPWTTSVVFIHSWKDWSTSWKGTRPKWLIYNELLQEYMIRSWGWFSQREWKTLHSTEQKVVSVRWR